MIAQITMEQMVFFHVLHKPSQLTLVEQDLWDLASLDQLLIVVNQPLTVAVRRITLTTLEIQVVTFELLMLLEIYQNFSLILFCCFNNK